MRIVATNKFANFNYFLMDKYTAGIVLRGSEIKSIRQNGMSLNESFVLISKNEAWLKNAYIKPYQSVNNFSPNPRRDRKLLLNRNEILKLKQNVERNGLTIVPVRAFFDKNLLKIEIALAQGKKNYDKKDDLKERDVRRSQERLMRL